ncbi:hypothetical protein [Pseudomonas savastanoi]|uniref:Uncharacterized protein n=2 Tax=Pseudomonas savastanoi TaxID=29438 RepID=A0AAW3M8A3_PSESS|nr:hypothetical protein [Pseudomonas savastanoi]KTC62387.1 hypothetical protein AO287_26345 [Pseudomonas savastanoi]RMM58404.1 hypothetical protein ALQ75_04147 [Pseudomonas savastanoi pv. glycinea]RMM93746.1 hypothetical protein ALQ68_01909 [Pseudomonas savastanoi pv. glycinea]RMP99831.1 hypothetical protein ALQ13_04053 [Pseudomonas savastanoi pv. glycinea]RMQ83776.1 hypothetical protein ALP96_03969 [Pseudomonas savastanoi pv. glycinea]
MSGTDNDFTKITKEQLQLKAADFDDVDIDDLNLGPVETPSAVQQQIAELKVKPPETNESNRVKSAFENARDELRKTIELYDDDIIKEIDNKLSFMSVEQNFSSSIIMEISRNLKKKDDFDPQLLKNLQPEIEDYLMLIDSRYSLYKESILNRNKDSRYYELFRRLIWDENGANKYYAKNLHYLDQAYLKNGFSLNKCSVLTPFHIMELFSGKNLKRYHLASLIDDLEEDRLPPVAGVDSHLPQL